MYNPFSSTSQVSVILMVTDGKTVIRKYKDIIFKDKTH